MGHVSHFTPDITLMDNTHIHNVMIGLNVD